MLAPYFLMVGFEIVWFSNGRALPIPIAIVPTIQNQDIFVCFQMVFDKMVAICLNFKWLDFRISDPIRNPDLAQPNLFLTIQNSDQSRFQISTILLMNTYLQNWRVFKKETVL